MGPVVLDGVELAPAASPPGPRARAASVARSAACADPARRFGRASRGRRGSGGRRRTRASLAPSVRARVAADRDVVELLGLEPGLREAPARRERREAGAVLDAVEALLLGGGDELAVDDERRGGVAVVGVEAEDRGHGSIVEPARCVSIVATPAACSLTLSAAARLEATWRRGLAELPARVQWRGGCSARSFAHEADSLSRPDPCRGARPPRGQVGGWQRSRRTAPRHGRVQPDRAPPPGEDRRAA